MSRVLAQYPRGSYYLTSKLPTVLVHDLDEARRIFDEQWERLDRTYLDFYLLHNLTGERWRLLRDQGVVDWCLDLQRQGLFRRFGFSFHGSYDEFEEILTAREWDLCQLQLNYMDTNEQAGLRGYALTEKRGVPLVIIFSIFLAHQINKKIRGRTIYRTLLFIPAITIPAAIGILWRWILNYQYGIFNWILEKLGFSRISWLGDVKYVRWAIILVVVWSMVSYYVIIMLAAMQGIDSSYYEAARLDGASSRQVFFKITLPMLTPMIFFSVIMVTIGILQIFDFIYLMVDRQTLSYTYSMSLVTYFYECAFNKSSMRGYGAAISVVLAAIIMVITMIQMVGKKYWVRSGE